MSDLVRLLIGLIKVVIHIFCSFKARVGNLTGSSLDLYFLNILVFSTRTLGIVYGGRDTGAIGHMVSLHGI